MIKPTVNRVADYAAANKAAGVRGRPHRARTCLS